MVGVASEVNKSKHRRLLWSKGAFIRLAILFACLAVALVWSWWTMILMPGKSHRGPLPPLTEREAVLAVQLRRDVEVLAGDMGDRSLFHPKKMGLAYEFLISRLHQIGYPGIEEIPVPNGAQTPNLAVELPGSTRPDEIVIIGAHYDSCMGTPGADDNATGVAGVLALAEAFAGKPQARTLRFVLFVNEEPPMFQTPDMGSWVYAKRCRARGDNIVGMLALESIGYYSTAPGSQKYPPPVGLFYPSTGDFIAFVGNFSSRSLVRSCVASFRQQVEFPSQGGAVPGAIPGVGWSDHWAFWQEGYPALMITCTAPFRNPNYHKETDTPETLDYKRTARVVAGLELVLTELATGG